MDKGLKTFSAAEAPWNTKAPAIPMVCIDEGSDVITRAQTEEMWSLAATEGRLKLEPGEVSIVTVLDDDAIEALVPHVNRVAALEAALVEVARLFDDGSSNDWEGCAEVRAILARVGLADRLPGNPTEAEEAAAS